MLFSSQTGCLEPRLSSIEQLGLVLGVAPSLHELPKGLEFELVVATAMNWRMGATLYSSIRERGIASNFPAEALTALHGSYLTIVMRNRIFRSQALEVISAFAKDGLSPVLLKGGIRLLSTPAGRDCTRFMEDLDLLLGPSDYRRADAIIRDMGFEAVNESGVDTHDGPKMRHTKTGLKIEIHRRANFVRHPDFDAGLALELQTLEIADELAIRIPSRRYQLLHNMIHAQEGHAGFLLGNPDVRQLYDFALGCMASGPRLDLRWLIDSSEAMGLGPHMRAWIHAAHRIFGLPCPALGKVTWVEKHQCVRICRDDNRSRFAKYRERIVHVLALALAGEMTLRELRQQCLWLLMGTARQFIQIIKRIY